MGCGITRPCSPAWLSCLQSSIDQYPRVSIFCLIFSCLSSPLVWWLSRKNYIPPHIHIPYDTGNYLVFNKVHTHASGVFPLVHVARGLSSKQRSRIESHLTQIATVWASQLKYLTYPVVPLCGNSCNNVRESAAAYQNNLVEFLSYSPV